MANLNFTREENGYATDEVDKYIELLQQEYQNAVAWGEENENKLNEMQQSMKELGLYFTLDADNQDEVIRRVFDQLTDTVNNTRAAAEQTANDILAKANEKSHAIVRQAMENSVELRTENTTIMQNLKSIKDMIEVVLEKGIQ
ncbi:MAG: DivIVA domain-containing protein [Clostridia bacterium]|nr:DivIVA domain-containing protein [Clostridia bacterium]